MLKRKKAKRIVALLITFLMCTCMFTFVFAKDTVYVERTADVVFIVDATGSMGDEIVGVKKALGDFINLIAIEDVDVRVKFVVYRDITCGEPTVCSEWYGVKDGAGSYLSSITATGGGDGPESIIDGYGMMLDRSFGFRSSATKYSIALTDADYKMDNNYGYTTGKEVIDKLTSSDISNSMIVSSGHNELYRPFCTNEGVLGDINGDYDIFLKNIAEKVIENVYSEDDYLMSPRSGKEGDGTIVTISANPDKSGVVLPKAPEVTFDGEKIEKVDYASGKASFKVPEEKIAGKYEVKMYLDGDSWSLGNFTVLSGAEYGDLSPKSATEGESTLVTVPVKKMNYSGSFAVYLNGSKVTVNDKKSDSFTFTVSSTLDVGEYIVTVNNGDIPIEVGSFTVEPKTPKFGEISVKYIDEGTSVVEKVVVSNVSKYADDFTVYMNGIRADVTYKGTSYFKFVVPSTMPVGVYSVSVLNYGRRYNVGQYEVVPYVPPMPKLGTINIKSGLEGQTVTEKIIVSDLSEYASDFKILVGDAEATISYKGLSYFKFTIPNTLKPGNYKCEAINSGIKYDLGTYTVEEPPIIIVEFGPLTVTEDLEGNTPIEKITVSDIPNYAKLKVTINGEECILGYTGNRYFKFTIPENIAPGTYSVMVDYLGNVSELGRYTVVPKPKVVPEFSKLPVLEGMVGDTISEKITYTNMEKYPDDFSILFGENVCNITYKGTKYFKFSIPSVVSDGEYEVKAICDGDEYVLGTYTVKPEPIPEITYGSLPISSGFVGESYVEKITIPEPLDYSAPFSVMVGSKNCELVYTGKYYFKFNIPNTLPEGTYDVVVNYKGSSKVIGAYTVEKVPVQKPEFKGLSVASGNAGDTPTEKVEFLGEFVYPEDFAIFVSGKPARLTYKGSSYFKFEMPSGLEAGVHEVKALFAGEEIVIGTYEVKEVIMPMFNVLKTSISGSTVKVSVSNITYGNLKVYVGGNPVNITGSGSGYFKFNLSGYSGKITVDYFNHKNYDLGVSY